MVTFPHENEFDETTVMLGFRGFFIQCRIDGNDRFPNKPYHGLADKRVMSADEAMNCEHGEEFLIELFEPDSSGTTSGTTRYGSGRGSRRSRGVERFLRSSCYFLGSLRFVGFGLHRDLLWTEVS